MRRRRDRRGRPRQANARRRATTLAGRAAPPDEGTPQLRRRKIRATSRPDLEIDSIGVLFGRGHLDAQQYDALGLISAWLRRAALAWGGEGRLLRRFMARDHRRPGQHRVRARSGDQRQLRSRRPGSSRIAAGLPNARRVARADHRAGRGRSAAARPSCSGREGYARRRGRTRSPAIRARRARRAPRCGPQRPSLISPSRAQNPNKL
jgi:hypothetical protein